ncbi:hypothetical protein [Corynebacterium sphenisci]|uniref:hypothetical protein n=1 Tax=Corynebacterium sphenisci TaxID=191493 RepID=UPI0026E073C3|nr:hypothetical protein [Corynebacterium sphenisci]MDO5730807.1 hypothetical protein [Corynebacterium sphenisci]
MHSQIAPHPAFAPEIPDDTLDEGSYWDDAAALTAAAPEGTVVSDGSRREAHLCTAKPTATAPEQPAWAGPAALPDGRLDPDAAGWVIESLPAAWLQARALDERARRAEWRRDRARVARTTGRAHTATRGSRNPGGRR